MISFHAILSGSCWAALAGGSDSSARFNAGDIVIYPRGDANVLSSAPGMRGVPDFEQYCRLKGRPLPIVTHHNDGGAGYCHLVCGYFGCDARPFNPLLEALPSMLLSQMSATGQSWLSGMLRLAAEEAEHGGAGSESLLARLAELVFIEVVRKYINDLPEDSKGWLSGLKHRHVGHALRLIHGQPAKPWTLGHAGPRSGPLPVGLCRSLCPLCRRLTDALSRSMAHAACDPASDNSRCQRRAGRSRGRLRIRSRFQPRLQEICRCAARLVAKGPVINGGPEMTPVG